MIIEVFVAQRQAIDPLANQFQYAVLDEFLTSVVRETRRQSSCDTQAHIDFAQQQRPAIRTDVSPIKRPHDRTTAQDLEARLDAEMPASRVI